MFVIHHGEMNPPFPRLYRNPAARQWRTDPLLSGVGAFHRSMEGYTPTPCRELPALSAVFGGARIFIKDESARLGLPAFKIVGASYAIARALSARLGHDGTLSCAELIDRRDELGPVELVAATDGNHGRAVAHMARILGLPARIFHPATISASAQAQISAEDATTVALDAPYDDVVVAARAYVTERSGTAGTGTPKHRATDSSGEGSDDDTAAPESESAAVDGRPQALLIQDTGWEGYTEIPGWIVDGYDTIFAEAEDQIRAAGAPPVSMVSLPVGVGSLAQTAIRRIRSATPAAHIVPDAQILNVEPTAAPCVIASLDAGTPVSVETGDTIMAGLNCGTVSSVAWPYLRDGVDLAVTVTDEQTADALDQLHTAGLDAGPCGAATLAGLHMAHEHGLLRLGTNDTVLLLSTESFAANPRRSVHDDQPD